MSPWLTPILPDGSPAYNPLNQESPRIPNTYASPANETPQNKLPQSLPSLRPRMLNSLERLILKVWARLHNAPEYHLIIETEVSLKYLDFVGHEVSYMTLPYVSSTRNNLVTLAYDRYKLATQLCLVWIRGFVLYHWR